MRMTHLLALSLLCTSQLGHALTPIEPVIRYDSMLEVHKAQQQASVLEFNDPECDLQAALERHLPKNGAKLESSHGLIHTGKVKLRPEDTQMVDLNYRIEGSGRGASATSVIVADLDEDFLRRDPNEPNASRAMASSPGALAFFAGLRAAVGSHDIDKRIAAQQEVAKKAERRQADLEKRRHQLDEALSESTQDFNKSGAESEKVKGALAEILMERKN